MFGFPRGRALRADALAARRRHGAASATATLQVRHCPGHTPGHVVFLEPTHAARLRRRRAVRRQHRPHRLPAGRLRHAGALDHHAAVADGRRGALHAGPRAAEQLRRRSGARTPSSAAPERAAGSRGEYSPPGGRMLPKLLSNAAAARGAVKEEPAMLDLLTRAERDDAASTSAAAPVLRTTPAPSGAARRSIGWRWLAAALDEIDYGIVLLGADGAAQHVNQVGARRAGCAAPAAAAARRAARARAAATRRRSTRALHDARRAACASCSRSARARSRSASRWCRWALAAAADAGDPAASARVGAELAVQGFARLHRLTGGEARVLAALCDGARPAEMARRARRGAVHRALADQQHPAEDAARRASATCCAQVARAAAADGSAAQQPGAADAARARCWPAARG